MSEVLFTALIIGWRFTTCNDNCLISHWTREALRNALETLGWDSVRFLFETGVFFISLRTDIKYTWNANKLCYINSHVWRSLAPVCCVWMDLTWPSCAYIWLYINLLSYCMLYLTGWRDQSQILQIQLCVVSQGKVFVILCWKNVGCQVVSQCCALFII